MPFSCYLLRLGQGEQELATDLDFSWHGRVNVTLVRCLELLNEVEKDGLEPGRRLAGLGAHGTGGKQGRRTWRRVCAGVARMMLGAGRKWRQRGDARRKQIDTRRKLARHGPEATLDDVAERTQPGRDTNSLA